MPLPPPSDPMVSHAGLLQPITVAIHRAHNACLRSEVEWKGRDCKLVSINSC